MPIGVDGLGVALVFVSGVRPLLPARLPVRFHRKCLRLDYASRHLYRCLPSIALPACAEAQCRPASVRAAAAIYVLAAPESG